MNKTIICLANSRKISGRCIAGKDPNDGHWIRPVSERDTHEISESDRQYQDGSTAQVLDIIEIPCKALAPQGYQSENVTIDADFYWKKIGNVTFDDLARLVDPGPLPWASDSSYSNLNDRVPEAQLNPQLGSLRLIHVDRLTLVVEPKAPAFNDMKRVVRAEFIYNRTNYRIAVTDPVIEREYKSRGDGRYEVHSAYLCISLGELFNGYAYKLVAGLFTRR